MYTNVKRKKTKQKVLMSLFTIGILGVLAVAIFLGYNIFVISKSPITLEDIASSNVRTVIYDCNGDEFDILGNGKSSNESDSFPELLKKAVISVEDKRFYHHEGFDPIRIGKAVLDTVKNGSFGAGGSTITQQLVKNLTGDWEMSLNRKIREVIYAISLEQQCSKEEILTRYLNSIYLGDGQFGMVDAIDGYFGTDPEDLSIAETAFMAAIIRSPETYINDIDRANNRKDLVLGCMLDQEMISEEEYEEAKDEYVEIGSYPKSSSINSWFTDSAIVSFASMMADSYHIDYDEAKNLIYKGGYKIYSTVDPSLQSEVYANYKSMPDDLGEVQGACVVLSKTGKVAAVCGGTGKKSSERLPFNRAISARRQPGSSIKPLAVYGPAFNEGAINSLSVYEDKEISYNGWTPHNYYGEFYGPMSIRRAITISNNSIPVQILYDIGKNTGIHYLEEMGFVTEPNDNALTLALGAVDIGYTPLEMASGYQCLCNGGVWCDPIFFTTIEAKDGSVVYDSSTMQASKRVFSEETAYIITDMLKSVTTSEEGTAPYIGIDGVEIAAKTGTTTNNNDKWFCCYTPDYVLSSWYGYDTPDTIDVSGRYIQRTARSILLETEMEHTSFDKPSTVNYYEVCKTTGLLASDKCQDKYTEIFNTTKELPIVCESCQGSIVDQVSEKLDDAKENFWGFIEDVFNPEEETTEVATSTDEYIYEEVPEEGTNY